MKSLNRNSYHLIFFSFLSLIISLQSSAAYSFDTKKEREEQEMIRQSESEEKFDFLLKIANNVTSLKPTSNKVFQIGVFGKNDEADFLYSSIKNKQDQILGKKLEVVRFKRINSLAEVDLIYLHKNSKVSLKELTGKISKNCIVVTEDYPYGSSTINFTLIGGELSYELQEQNLLNSGFIINPVIRKNSSRIENENSWIKRLDAASKVIQEKDKTISSQSELISSKKKLLKQKANKISSQNDDLLNQSEEIAAKKIHIQEQKKLITSITIGVIIAMLLISFLLILNKKRKQALAISEQKKREILASILYAKRIQNAFLPSSDLLNEHLKSGFIIYEPKDIVSGDFYWIEEHNGVIYFAVADCTGHGVPGALLSALCSTTLSRTVNELQITDPGKILDTSVTLLNAFFSKGNELVQDGMDISLCSLSIIDNTLQFSGANRPLIIVSKDGHITEYKGDKQPIGYYEKRTEYTTHTIELNTGDTLYMYSDGIPDQFGGEKDKKFGSKRLKQLLLNNYQLGIDEQKAEFERVFNAWRGEQERNDDACFIAVRVE